MSNTSAFAHRPFAYLLWSICSNFLLILKIGLPYALSLSCKSPLYILDTNLRQIITLGRYFLPICDFPIHFLCGVFWWQKLLIFKSNLSFFFCYGYFMFCPRNRCLPLMSPKYSPMFSSRNFMIVAFAFRSMIHKKLMFVFGVR